MPLVSPKVLESFLIFLVPRSPPQRHLKLESYNQPRRKKNNQRIKVPKMAESPMRSVSQAKANKMRKMMKNCAYY